MKASTKLQEVTANILFGALTDTFSQQLNLQKIKYDKKMMTIFQLDGDAITRLLIRGFINESTANKCRDKLFKEIMQHIKKQ